MRYKLPLNKITILFIIILAFPIVGTLGNSNKQGIKALPPKYFTHVTH